MNTNKLLFLHILISLISQNISWDYVKGGLDWPESCQSNINYDQGPLDISPPFISLKKTMHPFFKNITYSFHYSKLNTDYLYYNDGNNLITEGDFGYITFNNENYFSNQLHFILLLFILLVIIVIQLKFKLLMKIIMEKSLLYVFS